MIGVWHIEAEIIAALIVFILLIYSNDANMIPTLKNRLFRWCLVVFSIAITSNIISTILISTGSFILLTNIITTIYYLFTPFMTVIYYLYVICVIFPLTKSGVKKAFLLSMSVYFIYAFTVLVFPSVIYTYNGEYIRGGYNFLTYVVAYLYGMATVIITAVNHKRLLGYERNVLFVFPLVGVGIVGLQMLIPQYTLSGLGAAIPALILYLYLQNKQKGIDSLTMLSNRQIFLNLLKYKLYRQDAFVAVIIAPADFKYINEKFGSKTGDELLLQIADVLKNAVGYKNVFRSNGAKLALLLNKKEEDTVAILNSLAQKFKNTWLVGEYSIKIRVGIAYANCWEFKPVAEDIISVLEYGASLSKHKPTSSLEKCDNAMLKNIEHKHYILQLLKEETDKKTDSNFVVYYQPMYSLQSEKFTTAEALVRLVDKNTGELIPPNDFIPIAEESGLIIDIGYIVLERVCIFLRRILDEGKKIDCISVNVSVIQFMQTDLAKRIIQIIDKHNIPHSMIKLELTESAFAISYDTLKDTIFTLSDRDIKFALDDFGTGFSNISYFVGLPFDFVKMDKSLVWSAISDPKMASLLRHLIKAFTQIGLRVIVEGVENKAQDEFVRDCGCTLIQGFYYAKPMEENEAYKCLTN